MLSTTVSFRAASFVALQVVAHILSMGKIHSSFGWAGLGVGHEVCLRSQKPAGEQKSLLFQKKSEVGCVTGCAQLWPNRTIGRTNSNTERWPDRILGKYRAKNGSARKKIASTHSQRKNRGKQQNIYSSKQEYYSSS